ncbi:MAG: hypothetical protein INR68_18480 [Methylobacterium mesophilicum]|nr:hypothetical protein [Methylobacterium mesophilicum]
MANASKKHMGIGAQGKGDGSGAMAPERDDLIGENMILSNHDKAQHSQERGLDSKTVQADQNQDNPGARLEDGEEGSAQQQ